MIGGSHHQPRDEMFGQVDLRIGGIFLVFAMELGAVSGAHMASDGPHFVLG